MKPINFFARKAFPGNAYPHITNGTVIMRLSSLIRGEQMAEYLGEKYNPQEKDDNAIWIFIKPDKLDHIRDGDYVDYCDQSEYINLDKQLASRPKIKVLAIGQTAYEHLKKSIPNEVICLPQQHLNWENHVNPRKKPIVAGYIGRPSNISNKINTEIQGRLKNIGVDFKIQYRWDARQDSIDFFKSIDLLIISEEGLDAKYDSPFRTPTKMINAASFGVPSIATPIKGFKEMDGYYVPFKGIDQLVSEVQKFQDSKYYADFSDKIIEKAKEYHISEIAKKYRALK